MTLRDAGLIAIGFVAGMFVASASLALVAGDIEETDRVIRGLRLKFNPQVKGQG